MAHTPKPWRHVREEFGQSYRVQAEDGNICVPCYGRGDLDEDNARLIAAAPELLEACKLLISEGPSMDAYHLVRAAIAKAEGSSSDARRALRLHVWRELGRCGATGVESKRKE